MSVAVAPVAWPTPVRRGTGSGAVAASIMLVGIGLVIAATGFAIPIATQLGYLGEAVGRPQDVALLRSLGQFAWLISTLGLIHAIVGLGILSGRRVFRGAAIVLAVAGIVAATTVFVASVAAWGPFAGTGLARAGSPRMDGFGITLVAVLFEAAVLVAVGSAARHASTAD